MKQGITLVTPTGDRPLAFRLCEQWMSKQSITYNQWIVVDDGIDPTEFTMGQQYIRRERKAYDPPHTLHLNLLEALPHIEYDNVFIIEDDDYYRPNYLETYSEWLERNHIVGQGEAIYYSVVDKSWHQHKNTKHCSLCQTAFKSLNLSILEDICAKGPKFIDVNLWRLAAGRKKIDTSLPKLCIGMKGMPGRQNLACKNPHFVNSDLDLSKLDEIIPDSDVYKNFLQMKAEDDKIPPEIKGLRRDPNGCYLLLKRKPEIRALLDEYCIPVDPIRWRPKMRSFNEDLMAMKDMYKGKKCYIVGKGPSLDDIFIPNSDCPIICMNESIHKVESLGLSNPIYCIQQDAKLKDSCWSSTGTMLVSYLTQSWYAEHPKCIAYNPKDFPETRSGHPLSIEMAIHFAKHWGCERVILKGCDALKNEKTSYAKCIGYNSDEGGDPKRFLQHRKYVYKALGDMKYTVS